MLEGFKASFQPQLGVDIQVSKNGSLLTNGKIATGMKVKILNNGSEEENHTIVLYGDVDGDGTISVIDLLKIKKNLLGMISLTGANKVAANLDRDELEDVSVIDLLFLKQHLLKIKLISQN